MGIIAWNTFVLRVEHPYIVNCEQSAFPGKMGLVNCLFLKCAGMWRIVLSNLTLDVIEDCIPHCVRTIY